MGVDLYTVSTYSRVNTVLFLAVLELRTVMIAFVPHSLYFLFYLVITTLDLAKKNLMYINIYMYVFIIH